MATISLFSRRQLHGREVTLRRAHHVEGDAHALRERISVAPGFLFCHVLLPTRSTVAHGPGRSSRQTEAAVFMEWEL